MGVRMTVHTEEIAIRVVVAEYLEGMIYGQYERLRACMHPLCMQAGHDKGNYEFFTRENS